MSEIFYVYERQYCELSACLSQELASAALLDGEQKKQKVSEIKGRIEDTEALIRKMDQVASSLPPNVSALLAKLREYKTDLNNLKTEVKRITEGLARRSGDNISTSQEILANMPNLMKWEKWIIGSTMTACLIVVVVILVVVLQE